MQRMNPISRPLKLVISHTRSTTMQCEHAPNFKKERRTKMTEQNLIDYAIDYVRKGFPVIPICPANHKGVSAKHLSSCTSPGKAPLISGWQQYATEIPTEYEITTWWKQNPYANLGDALGHQIGRPNVSTSLDINFIVSARQNGKSWREIAISHPQIRLPSGKKLNPSTGSIRRAYDATQVHRQAITSSADFSADERTSIANEVTSHAN